MRASASKLRTTLETKIIKLIAAPINHQWSTYTAKMSTNLKGIASFVRHVEVIACNPATVNIAFAYSMTLTDEHDAGKQIPWTKSKLFLWAKDPISCQSKLPTPSDVRLLEATADNIQCCPWMPSCRNLTHSVKWPGFPRLPCKRPDGSFAHVSNTEVIFMLYKQFSHFFLTHV